MKKYSVNLEDLLQDGFSHKFATYYLSLVEKEMNNPYYDTEYVKWAHENGFLAENAYAYNLTPENMHLYLSDYEYYKAWPINNWTRLWVDDKMTLKQEGEITEPLYELEVQTGVSISPMVMLKKQWENRPFQTPFSINIANEGIVL